MNFFWKLAALAVAAAGSSAAVAQTRYGLGVDTNLRPNPAYMQPSTGPRSTPSVGPSAPSRGIPDSFRPPMPQPRSPFDDALRHPIQPPTPRPAPPVHIDAGPGSHTTVTVDVPAGRGTMVSPSLSGTAPAPVPNAPPSNIDGAGVSVQKAIP
jgi:hypothetical protein